MNGSNDRFASEEGTGPGDPRPSGPGSDGGDDSSSADSVLDSLGYENGDDAFPGQSPPPSGPIELWEDDVRRVRNKNGTFEMVPLTPGNSDDDGDLDGDGEFEYSDDDEDGGAARIRRRSNHAGRNVYPGDDYATSTSLLARALPRRAYHYLYPPGVPRQVQLLRLENLAVPACYLLVGLLQGLSGPFTNVYPLDLNASEAQQVRMFFTRVRDPSRDEAALTRAELRRQSRRSSRSRRRSSWPSGSFRTTSPSAGTAASRTCLWGGLSRASAWQCCCSSAT